MSVWDSAIKGGSLRLAPAILGVAVLGMLLSLAPVSGPVEKAIYDTVLGFEGRTASSQIMLLDTRDLEQDAASLWEADSLPHLLETLGEAGARLVVPLDPPPVGGAFPDAGQLAALAEIARRGGETGETALPTENFQKRLADMQHHAKLQASTLAAVTRLRNTLVSVPLFEGARFGQASSSGGCSAHLLTTRSADDGSTPAALRQVRGTAAPPEALCRVALGAGHVHFWADQDGVLRRHHLLVATPEGQVPSLALRAAHTLSFPSAVPPILETRAISWDSTRLRTSGPATLLTRYYPAPDDALPFATLDAQELLDSPALAEQLQGRIVLLGHAGLDADDRGYRTPLATSVPGLAILGTMLSNLLQEDYIVEPVWSGWLTALLMLLVGLLALLGGRRMPLFLALAISLFAAAAALSIEIYLLMGPGIWLSLGSVAAFAILATLIARLGSLQLQPAATSAAEEMPAAPEITGTTEAAVDDDEELDLAFSVLRQQVPSTTVKQRLYDIALEHARRRDLAKAERVLRHLAGIDPDYRRAGEKLQKLAGMRAQPAETPVQEDATPDMRPIAQPMVELPSLHGHTIGRYEIDKIIGRGAMATVYLGRDPKINRLVAVKTIALAEEFSDSDLDNARTQFLREAESAGRLNHPAIISIYDAGEDEKIAYLAMEYFPGKPLSHYARQGSLLPVRRVLELTARIAEALHYAHGQHVVHRDVKPANIMYDRETDTLKITDFGIARLTDSSRTKTGIILGTPSYMSPEQLSGTNVTGQSDIFSLGITLYQLLTGHPPFRADSIPRLMQKITHETHAPVSQLRDELPPCLDEILDVALAKDPSDRFPSGRAMALTLRNCCARMDSLPAAHSA